MTKDEFIKSIIPEINKDVYEHSKKLTIEIEGIVYTIKKDSEDKSPMSLKYWDYLNLVVCLSEDTKGGKPFFDEDGQTPLPDISLSPEGYLIYEEYRKTLTHNKPIHVASITTFGDDWEDTEDKVHSTLDEMLPYISGKYVENMLKVSGIKRVEVDVSLFMSRREASKKFTLDELRTMYSTVDNFARLFIDRKL